MSYNIGELLSYARGKEENYNRISNILYENFNIHSAELTLVSLFVYEEMRKKSCKTEGKTIEENGNM